MAPSPPRLTLLVALAAAVLTFALGPRVSQAQAALALPSLGAPPAARTIAPVAAPIAIDPAAGPTRGTVILVHAGGWAGHDADAQSLLATSPGELFLERGWRIGSVDYEGGTAGPQDVLNAAGAELSRGRRRWRAWAACNVRVVA